MDAVETGKGCSEVGNSGEVFVLCREILPGLGATGTDDPETGATDVQAFERSENVCSSVRAALPLARNSGSEFS